ncbi:unnamed protein product [Moneuplotes crassus]|uniref:Uncharacterized protein n=1 Tax=Euplotes crassus TaxID=5936 RepID=A0AAD1U6G7_EUPCR|nr:unnamed protein product [Moneuplotes crassus]
MEQKQENEVPEIFKKKFLSRVGKFTAEKHLILKKVVEILNGTQKKFIIKPNTFSSKNGNKNGDKNLPEWFDMDNQKNIQIPLLAKMMRAQTMGKTTPKKKTNKDKPLKRFRPNTQSAPEIPVSTRGITINYSLIDKRPSCMKWTLKKTVSKKVIDKSEPALENIILKDKQTGFIDYGRMKKREKFHKMQTVGNPHPKRFISFNAFPSSSTRAKKVVTKDIKKSLGRDSDKYQINLTPSVYEPTPQEIHCYPFSKMLPRPPLMNQKAISSLNNNSVVLDNIEKYEKKNSKYKSVSSPNFSSYKGRQPRDPRMPMFMEGINSRMALNTINKKMLQTNHFDESYVPMPQRSTERLAQTAGPSMFRSQSQPSLMSKKSNLN